MRLLPTAYARAGKALRRLALTFALLAVAGSIAPELRAEEETLVQPKILHIAPGMTKEQADPVLKAGLRY